MNADFRKGYLKAISDLEVHLRYVKEQISAETDLSIGSKEPKGEKKDKAL